MSLNSYENAALSFSLCADFPAVFAGPSVFPPCSAIAARMFGISKYCVAAKAIAGISTMVAISAGHGLAAFGAGAGAGVAVSGSCLAIRRSALEVDDFVEHVVGDRDDARSRLEAALRGDQVRKLLAQIDVRLFERADFDP